VKRTSQSLSAKSSRRIVPRLFLLALAFLAFCGAATRFSFTKVYAIVVSPPSIVKSFSAASAPLNTSVTLTFTITNPNGATDLTGVSFNDNLPAGLIIANPDSLTGTCDPGVITPAVTNINLVGGTILAGSSCTFSVDVLAIAGGTQVNTTDPVTSNEGGTGNTATASVDVLLPDLTILKSHTGNFRQTQVGATYTITVTNSGPATTTNAVTVTDTLPVGLTATAIGGVGWACTTPPTLRCTRPDALDPGLSFTDITVTVNVANNAPPTVTNTAVVSGGGEGDATNDTSSDPASVDAVSDLTITKTHSGIFVAGQTGATYTITVSNLGPGPTFGTVTVTDTLPNVPNTLVPTALSGAGWTCTLGTLTCTRSDVLLAGASYPTISLTVNIPSNISGNITNTATVSGGNELNTANDTATDTTTSASPLKITPINGSAIVPQGGSASFSFTVTASTNPPLGTITFACPGAPFGVTCTFNPASVSQPTTTVTMTVNTTGGTSAALQLPSGGNRAAPLYAALVLPLPLLGLVGILAGIGKSAKKKLCAGLFCLGLLAVLAFAGCQGSTVTQGTPLGSFPLSVTATSTASPNVQATTSVILTVR
jgi:uncharacterized repeat protein (TIGR01451 family)